jgi:hypothetical protein
MLHAEFCPLQAESRLSHLQRLPQLLCRRSRSRDFDFFLPQRVHGLILQHLPPTSNPSASSGWPTQPPPPDLASLALQVLKASLDVSLGMDAASLGPMKLFNFELSAGPIDESIGPPEHHPFLQVTFSVICSVTASGKYFAITVPLPNNELFFGPLNLTKMLCVRCGKPSNPPQTRAISS